MVNTVEMRVKKLIAEHLGADAQNVTPDALLEDDLGADSLDRLELVMAFEEEFECEIPDEQAEKIRTVQDAVNLINTKEQ